MIHALTLTLRRLASEKADKAELVARQEAESANREAKAAEKRTERAERTAEREETVVLTSKLVASSDGRLEHRYGAKDEEEAGDISSEVYRTSAERNGPEN
jgi:septal ring factor EnvC (AmiA/AmiB activator)